MSKILSFDFEYEHDYILIGIHSSLEDYRMAFFLNDSLNLKLGRYKDDLDFEKFDCSFSLYDYEDIDSMTSWSLISNKYINLEETVVEKNNLFKNESRISYLIPEKNKVDFFLKINGPINEKDIQDILFKINKTKKIITSYTINPNQIKSKDFLIF